MKIFTMKMSGKERVLLLILVILAIGLSYYQFVDRPVRKALEIAQVESDSLSTELTVVEGKLARMRRMRNEMEDITVGGSVKPMPSYNNVKSEIELLNNILAGTGDYSINFTNVTRDGDQVRRNFSLQFTTDSYASVDQILGRLSDSPYRCRLGDIRCSVARNGDLLIGEITISVTATFFETMVGGVPDTGLPQNTVSQS